MNRRKQDQLIGLAFGEISEDAMAELGQKEAEKLQQLRDLKKSLVAARSIPEHQLSNDRLRHAILGQGLSPSKVTPQSEFGWLWSSLGICGMVALLVIVVGRQRMPLTPTINMKGAEQVAERDFQFAPSQPLLQHAAVAVNHSARHPRITSGYRVSEALPMTAELHFAHPRKRYEATPDSSVDPRWVALQSEGPDNAAESEIDTPLGRTAELKTPAPSKAAIQDALMKKPNQDSVVEIEQGQDDDTGARAAREIASKNVLVGG